MKRLGLLFSVALLFAGCAEHNWSDTVVTNGSSFPVTFKFRHTEEYPAVAPGASRTFGTVAYQLIEYYSPDKRVLFEYTAANSGATGVFRDRVSYSVKVTNGTAGPVTLDADGWMAPLENIPAGAYADDDQHNGRIYTDSPVFSVAAAQGGFPARAYYDRDSDGTFRVTVGP